MLPPDLNPGRHNVGVETGFGDPGREAGDELVIGVGGVAPVCLVEPVEPTPLAEFWRSRTTDRPLSPRGSLRR